jgi:competence protein ComEC
VILVLLAIAWISGIIATDVLAITSRPLLSAALAGLLLSAAAWRTRWMRLLGLVVLCAALGGLRYQAAQIPSTPHSVWLLIGQGDVTLQGMITADPKRTEEGQQVIVQTQFVLIQDEVRQVEGLVLVKLPPYPQYHYGQQVSVSGKLQQPRAAERPGEFDYRAYLARKGIFTLMKEPLIQVLPGEGGNPWLKSLLAFRDDCKTILLRELPEPHASLAIGILLGLQSSVPAEVMAAFSATGTSHILVVSGWNFTIVASILASLATRLRLRRGVAFGCSLAVMWAYALFVGAAPGVLRAAVMASLVVLANTTERRSEPWTLLFAACWGLSIYDPQSLWDLGFQLSVLATASLFAFGKPVERWLQRCPPLRWPTLGWATEALTATLAAQILALPIILFHFGNLSIVAPLANILIVPVVPYAMFLGTAALLCGLIWLPLGQWIALGVWAPLSWMAEGALLLARLPFASVQLPPFPLWLLLAYYATIIGWFLWKQWALQASSVEAPAAFLTVDSSAFESGSNREIAPVQSLCSSSVLPRR